MSVWERIKNWWNGPQDEDEDDFFTRYDAQRRAEDPDYDEKQLTHRRNMELRERRKMLAQQEENIRLAGEIQRLEARAAKRRGDGNG